MPLLVAQAGPAPISPHSAGLLNRTHDVYNQLGYEAVLRPRTS